MTSKTALRSLRRAPSSLLAARMALAGLAATTISMMACAVASDPPLQQVSQRMVYGNDDRLELYQVAAEVQNQALGATIALVPTGEVDFSVPRFRSAPLRSYKPFCEGVRFLDQPSPVLCSGALIDDDLVLTAGHCIEDQSTCRALLFVMNLAYTAPGQLAPLSRDQIYGCRRLAVRKLSTTGTEQNLDYAIVQLDRPVAGARPFPLLGTSSLRTDAPPTVFGFPEGVPMKVDRGARILDARTDRGDFFSATTDTFVGSSGSPLLDGNGRLAGVLARGNDDYEKRGKCFADVVLASDAETTGEEYTYADRAVDALCQNNWPSERLCGQRGSCGDGICASNESPESCPRDCMPARCGDNLCEVAEWSSCPTDCGDRRPAQVPNEWYCAASSYGTSNGCNCTCGAFDPDCGSPSSPKLCDRYGPMEETIDSPPASGGSCAVAAARGTNMREFGAFALLLLGLLCRQRRRRTGDTGRVSCSRPG